jgi:hypothetical protein
VLNKLLFLDLSRQTLSPGILTDFDATAAFDRVLAGLSIVTSQRMGLPRVAGIFMYQLLYNMSFNLITGFGTSSYTYNNTDNNLSSQGVLQGSNSAAPLFILNSDVSLHTYNRIGSGASFVHPITRSTINDKGVQYVDDTSLFLNSLGAGISSSETSEVDTKTQLKNIAAKNSNTWSDCLWTSGGCLNIDKCFYYYFSPKYNVRKVQCQD